MRLPKRAASEASAAATVRSTSRALWAVERKFVFERRGCEVDAAIEHGRKVLREEAAIGLSRAFEIGYRIGA